MPTLLNQQSCHIFSAFISFNGEQVTIRKMWPASALLNSFCHFSGVLPKVVSGTSESKEVCWGDMGLISVEKDIRITFIIIYHSSVSHYSAMLMRIV